MTMRLLSFNRFTIYHLGWGSAAIVSSIFLFILFAGYKITYPGLYYDELLFVNAALGGNIDLFIHKRLGQLPLMLMPYIGALKSWLYYPIFKLFDVTAYSIRLPVIAIGAFTLFVNHQFVKTAFSRHAALIFVLLSAVEPSTIYHTRLDWGPTTLMMLFRGILLLSVFAWLKTQKSWLLLVAISTSFLGVFDKLNFIWFLPATLLSLILCYPRELLAFIRSHRRVVLICATLCSTFLIVLLLYTPYNLPLKNEIAVFDFSSRLKYLSNHMLLKTISGTGVYEFIVGDASEIGKTHLIFIIITLLISFIAMIFSKSPKGETRALLFLISFIIITLLQMFITRQATGPHHASMIAPLWLIPISVWLGRVFAPNNLSGWRLKGLAIIAIIGLFISSLIVNILYLKGFQTSVRNHRWDRATYKVAQILYKYEDRPIVCVDWGLGTIMHGLFNGKKTVYDRWPTFKDGLNEDHAEYLENGLLTQKPYFLIYATGKETFPETRKNFFDIAAVRGWNLNKLNEINGQDGSVLIEIYQVNQH